MEYRLLFSERAKNEIQKLDYSTKKLLENWLNKHLVNAENPRAFGRALTADKKGFWRYRIGSYRLICRINDGELIVLALAFGHRGEIYKNSL